VAQNGSVVYVGDPTRGFMVAATTTGGSALTIFWRELSGAGWSAWREFFHFPTTATGLLHMSATGLTVSEAETDGVTVSEAEYGFYATTEGAFVASRLGNVPAFIKRSDDGVLVRWYVGATNVGAVSSSGGVVTYGSFCGAHWSQFKSMAKPNVLPGTIVETIDRLCIWEDGEETVLPQVVVAKPGSPAVYGVFSHWDEKTRDIYVASLGSNSIRIAPGVTVKRGDLIEAGKGGMGVVQADDIVRSRTVAKITAAVVTKSYEDGSYLVPCTLHCG
jgi:hypothetical protein